MDDLLEPYRDAEVQIHYLTDNGVYTDSGRLTNIGDRWVELVKNYGKRNAETFLVPISSIRIMKVVKLSESPHNLLLRPVGAEPNAADDDPLKLTHV